MSSVRRNDLVKKRVLPFAISFWSDYNRSDNNTNKTTVSKDYKKNMDWYVPLHETGVIFLYDFLYLCYFLLLVLLFRLFSSNCTYMHIKNNADGAWNLIQNHFYLYWFSFHCIFHRIIFSVLSLLNSIYTTTMYFPLSLLYNCIILLNDQFLIGYLILKQLLDWNLVDLVKLLQFMILRNLKNANKILFNCYINCIAIINNFNIVYWCLLRVCTFTVYFVSTIFWILSYI